MSKNAKIPFVVHILLGKANVKKFSPQGETDHTGAVRTLNVFEISGDFRRR